MEARTGSVDRETRETSIRLELNLDGDGLLKTAGGVDFFNHLLNAFTKYALFDIKLSQKGDLEIDAHHLVEDIGICLGQAFRKALGDKEGIKRFGWSLVPMDEALASASVDLCGRSSLHMDYSPIAQHVGTFDVALVREFLLAFVQHGGFVLHLQFLRGFNDHHVLEGAFKALGWALREAVSQDPRVNGVPSTKGTLD